MAMNRRDFLKTTAAVAAASAAGIAIPEGAKAAAENTEQDSNLEFFVILCAPDTRLPSISQISPTNPGNSKGHT